MRRIGSTKIIEEIRPGVDLVITTVEGTNLIRIAFVKHVPILRPSQGPFK